MAQAVTQLTTPSKYMQMSQYAPYPAPPRARWPVHAGSAGRSHGAARRSSTRRTWGSTSRPRAARPSAGPGRRRGRSGGTCRTASVATAARGLPAEQGARWDGGWGMGNGRRCKEKGGGSFTDAIHVRHPPSSPPPSAPTLWHLGHLKLLRAGLAGTRGAPRPKLWALASGSPPPAAAAAAKAAAAGLSASP